MKCYETSLQVLVKLKDLSGRISAEGNRVIIKEKMERKEEGKNEKRCPKCWRCCNVRRSNSISKAVKAPLLDLSVAANGMWEAMN